MAWNKDGSVKDDGTRYGYYASRRENRLEAQAKREVEVKKEDTKKEKR